MPVVRLTFDCTLRSGARRSNEPSPPASWDTSSFGRYLLVYAPRSSVLRELEGPDDITATFSSDRGYSSAVTSKDVTADDSAPTPFSEPPSMTSMPVTPAVDAVIASPGAASHSHSGSPFLAMGSTSARVPSEEIGLGSLMSPSDVSLARGASDANHGNAPSELDTEADVQEDKLTASDILSVWARKPVKRAQAATLPRISGAAGALARDPLTRGPTNGVTAIRTANSRTASSRHCIQIETPMAAFDASGSSRSVLSPDPRRNSILRGSSKVVPDGPTPPSPSIGDGFKAGAKRNRWAAVKQQMLSSESVSPTASARNISGRRARASSISGVGSARKLTSPRRASLPAAHRLTSPRNSRRRLSVSMTLQTAAAASTSGQRDIDLAADYGLSASDDELLERPYTISRPHDGAPNKLVLYVRRYPTGSVSRFLTSLRLGQKLLTSVPLGLGLRLDHEAASGTLLCVVQGTGVVTYLDMINHVADAYFTQTAEDHAEEADVSHHHSHNYAHRSRSRMPVTRDKLRVSMIACFESERDIVERERLEWLHAHCPHITIQWNFRRPAAAAADDKASPGPRQTGAAPPDAASSTGGDAAASGAFTPPTGWTLSAEPADVKGPPKVSYGHLSPQLLVGILPEQGLLCVSCCGKPAFTNSVRQTYADLGLPRSLFVAC